MSRPLAPVAHRFAWRYLVGFVQPASGRTLFHLASGGSIPLFAAALAAFAAAVGAGPGKQIVLVVDRAGWHTSLRRRGPDHVHLLFLPPYCPELNPAEHLLGSVAADEHGAGQPALYDPRRRGGRAGQALRHRAGAARSCPRHHLLPLLAPAHPHPPALSSPTGVASSSADHSIGPVHRSGAV